MKGSRVRVLIVDDEPLARRGILLSCASVEMSKSSVNVRTGWLRLRSIIELAPDVVFL